MPIQVNQLNAWNAMVNLAGVGRAKVRISSVLDATMSGLGSIEYIGNPPRLDKHMSGLGQVKRVSQ
jgi:Putative auto-transporter adhesin, head GIN domain